jgi:DNA-binding transcriptional ArsR family regulator
VEDLTIHRAYILVAIQAWYAGKARPKEVFCSIKKMRHPFEEYHSAITVAQLLRGPFYKNGLVISDGCKKRPRYKITEEGSRVLESYIKELLTRGLARALSFEEILFLYNAYSSRSALFDSKMLEELKFVSQLAVHSFEQQLQLGTPYLTHILLKNNTNVLKTFIKEVLPKD